MVALYEIKQLFKRTIIHLYIIMRLLASISMNPLIRPWTSKCLTDHFWNRENKKVFRELDKWSVLGSEKYMKQHKNIGVVIVASYSRSSIVSTRPIVPWVTT